MKRIPKAYFAEFQELRRTLMRNRISVLILTASGICFGVSFQYALRHFLFKEDAFRFQEFYIWTLLFSLGAWVAYLNQRTKTLFASKMLGFFYHVMLMLSLGAVGVVYAENALLFAFYFSFALALTCIVVPWSIKDTAFLTVVSMLAFSLFHAYVRWGLGIHVPAYNRFNPFGDGLIFIGIGAVLGFVVRRNQNDREVENFVLLKQVEEKNRQTEQELGFAAHIHETLIPLPISHRLADVSVEYVPARHVGGDYARFGFLGEQRLLFFMSDVTGHGVPAALLVNRLHAEFERLALKHPSSARLMAELNDFIVRDFGQSSMYLSGFCGVLDFDKNELVYSGHGHPAQYLVRARSRAIEALDPQNGLLGLPLEGLLFTESTISFEAGDEILLFTDGVTEAGTQEDFFGEKRLIDFLSPVKGSNRALLSRNLISELRKFTNNRFYDDIFIVHIRTKQLKAAASGQMAFSQI